MHNVTEMAVACPGTHPNFASFCMEPRRTHELAWFALQVKQHGRTFTEEMLGYAGLEFFSPCVIEERSWSDRKKVVLVPLFPGYIFCRFDPNVRLPVLQTPGVISVVSAGKKMLEIDGEEIAAIRIALQSSRPIAEVPYLAVGEQVVIRTGPLTGLRGAVERYKGKSRLLLSVTMLNRSVSVELDARDVA